MSENSKVIDIKKGVFTPFPFNDSEEIKPAIDPLASVHKDAFVDEGCTIGPYAVIGKDVRLGKGCVVHPHGVITGNTRLGSENEVFPFACIGGDPQDLRHNGEATTLIIGNKNIFREHVTVNRGTVHGGGSTVIGNNNLIMAYSHIAHDCIIGDRVVIANNGTLAGHVEVYDYAVFGGGVQVASFMRIGESAMLAAGAMVDRDVPPFSMVAGDRAKLQGTNRVGMIRREFSSDVRLEIKQIIKQLIRKDELKKIVMEYSDRTDVSKESLRLIEFLSSASRGVVR